MIFSSSTQNVMSDVQIHATQNCPDFPILRTHMRTIVKIDNAPVVNIPTIPAVKNKSLQTNHPCANCGLYGHYSHHFPNLSKYRSLLSDLHKNSRESKITILGEIHPSASSSYTNNTIYMISTSSRSFPSSSMEYPSDLSMPCFHNDEEIIEAL